MADELIHPCDVQLGDVVEWYESPYKATTVEEISPSEKHIEWLRLDDNYRTGTTYHRHTTVTLLKVLSHGTIVIEEDLTPADVG